MTRTELFLQTLVSIFSPGMVKSYFPFLLLVFLSGQNYGQNNNYILKQCLNTKKLLYCNLKTRSDETTLTRLEVACVELVASFINSFERTFAIRFISVFE